MEFHLKGFATNTATQSGYNIVLNLECTSRRGEGGFVINVLALTIYDRNFSKGCEETIN